MVQHRGELEHDEDWKVTACCKTCCSAGVAVMQGGQYSRVQYTQTPKHNNLDDTDKRPKLYNGTFLFVESKLS